MFLSHSDMMIIIDDDDDDDAHVHGDYGGREERKQGLEAET